VIKDNIGSATTDGYGSGLYTDGGVVRVIGSHLKDNWSATGNGGGLDSAWSEIEITGNHVLSNTCSEGAGLYVRSTTPVTIANNMIIDNEAASRGGGVYVVENVDGPTPALLVNNTLADNHPEAVATWGASVLTLTNNLFTENPVGIFSYHPASLTFSADTNLFWDTLDPLTGTNALIVDPLVSDHHDLEPDSPAIDAGLTMPWLTVDVDGDPRPQRTAYDIGADEYRVTTFLPLVMR